VEKKISDIQLVEKIKLGDMAYFEILVERHKNYAFTIADRILNNEQDAEEVAYDAFVKLLDVLHSFKGDSKFSTWFYRVVMNMAISRTRKKRIKTEEIQIHHEKATGVASFDEFGGIDSEERSYYLNLAIARLKEQERLLITLYYLDELDMDEIEKLTNIDKANLKVKIFRARKKLALELKALLSNELESIL
jgi:RNA polymerase sigma-70 factor (ECF subfamily)